MNKKRKTTTVKGGDAGEEEQADPFDQMGMYNGLGDLEPPQGKKKTAVGYNTVSGRYHPSNTCPLCKQGYFTFSNTEITNAFGNLVQNTVFYISRNEIVANLKDLLDSDLRRQEAEFAQGITTVKPDQEVTTEEIMTHLSDHMTEYTWELRTQIDDLRDLIKILKDKIIEVDTESGVENINQKNVQLLQMAQANLRKIFVTEVQKSLSYNPGLTYNKATALNKE